MLGSIPSDDLVAMFGAAWVLVFPSLFEGIGMPLLEAMQYGLPVIASNVTCLPEVAGDAALYLDPLRVDAIADALLAAHQRPDLLEHRRRAAPAALARYDWPRAARTYVACYRAVAGATHARAAGALRQGHRLMTRSITLGRLLVNLAGRYVILSIGSVMLSAARHLTTLDGRRGW